MKFEKQEKEKVYVNLNMDGDDMNLVINGKLELHITTSEGNLSVDAYHVFNGQDDNLEHDYDEDFITGLGWLSQDDIDNVDSEN